MLQLIINNPIARIVVLGLIFAVAMGVVIMVLQITSRRSRAVAELRAIQDKVTANSSSESLIQQTVDSTWAKVVERLERFGLDLTDSKSDALRRKMIAAGFDSPAAPKIFTLIRLIMIFVLPSIYVMMATSGAKPISPMKLYLIGFGAAIAGLYLPNLFIAAKADRRREEIVNGFPDCLDLLLVCVEAGLGMEAAMDRVGREMVNAQPLVSRLLIGTTLLMRAGAAREAALRSMGESSGVDEIKSFATLLIQSDKLGTSVSATLRVYAAEMREKRRMRAEEKAHRLPVLISIPLVVCMLPVMIGVLLLPAVIRVIRQLAPALTGG
jgi:tight adherence protein C